MSSGTTGDGSGPSKRLRRDGEGEEEEEAEGGALALLPFEEVGPVFEDTEAAGHRVIDWVGEIVRHGKALQALQSVCADWQAPAYASGAPLDPEALMAHFFGAQLALPPFQRLEAVNARRNAWLLAVRGLARAVRLLLPAAAEGGDPAQEEALQQAGQVVPLLINNLALRASSDAVLTRGPPCDELMEQDKDAEGSAWFQEQQGATATEAPKTKSTELYVRALFSLAEKEGYALGANRMVLKQRLTAEGLPTRAWMTVPVPGGGNLVLESMLARFSAKDTSVGAGGAFRLLCDSYSQNNRAAEMELAKGVDAQFPRLHKSRGVFSFRDGLYVAHYRNAAGEETMADSFYCYGSRIEGLPNSAISANYFDADVAGIVGTARWQDIATPTMSIVLDHQQFSQEVQELFYVCVGRILYEVGNSLDDWQIFPYLLGEAGSGKSLLVEAAVGGIYAPEDRGTLSTNMEKKFGLSALLNKFVVLGPEISSSMTFDQCEIQSMASGETMKANIKGKTGMDLRWTAPIWLAGNQTPSWQDNAGSLLRRVVTFPFRHSVTAEDRRANPDLPGGLAAELPALIIKANRAYRERARASPNVLIQPAAIAQVTRDVLGQTTTLAQLMHQPDRVELGPELRCRWADLLAALRDYEKDTRTPVAKCMSKQMNSMLMAELALKPFGCRREGSEVVGCRLAVLDFGGGGGGGGGGGVGGGAAGFA